MSIDWESLRRKREEEFEAEQKKYAVISESETDPMFKAIALQREQGIQPNKLYDTYDRLINTSQQPTRNTSTSSLAPWADKNSANSLPSTYEMYVQELAKRNKQEADERADAAKVINLSKNPTYQDVTDAEKRMEQGLDKASKSNQDTSKYQKALEMLKEFKSGYTLDSRTSPEDRQSLYAEKKAELEKAKSGNDETTLSRKIDDANVDEVKKALGTAGNHDMSVDEAADFYVKYRTGAIQYDPDSENHKRYLGLKSLIEAYEKAESGRSIEAEEAELRKYERDYPNDFYQLEKQDPNYGTIVKDQYTKSEYVPIQDMDTLTVYRLYKRGDFDDTSKLSKEDSDYIQRSLNKIDAMQLKHMTSDDEERYYYLLATKGKDEAEQYLEKLKPLMQKTDTEQLKEHADIASDKMNEIVTNAVVDRYSPAPEQTKKALEDNNIRIPVAGVATIPLRVAGSFMGNAENYAKMLSGEEIEPYSSAHALSQVGRAAVEHDAKYIDEKTNGFNIGGMTAGDMYQAALSGVESISEAAVLGPEATAFLMSTQSAEQKAEELYERGATPQQIFIGSTAAAAFEYITEKVSLDTIVNKIIKKQLTKKTLPRFLLSALESSGVEGSEEIASSVANYFTDIINMRDKSERQELIKKYTDEGKSKEEAEKLATRDFLRSLNEDFAGGFIGGFVGGGGVSVASGVKAGAVNTAERVAQSQAIRNTGAAITGAGNTQALIDKAKNSTDEAVQKQAEKVEQLFQSQSEKNEKTGKEKSSRKLNKEAGTLFDMLQEREIEDTQSPLRTLHDELSEKIVAETGSENEDAVNVIIKSQFNRGAELTGSEQALLDTPVMQKIVNDSQDLFRKASDSTAQAWQSMGETSALMQKTNQDYDTFDPTDDGLTYINGQNTPVEVSKVIAVTGGNYDVELTNGSTVKASDLNFGDSAVPAILSGMLDTQEKHGTQMSPEFVNSAVKLWQEGGYNPGSLNGYIADAQEAFYAGNSNNTEYKPQVMSQGAYDALYKAAAETKSAAITAKGTQIEANKTATRREGAVLFESADGTNVNISSSRDMARQGIHLNDLQKVGIDMVTNLSKSTGLTFRFFRSQRNSNGVYVSKYSKESNGKQKASPNGFYKNGEIYVDINAGNNGEGLIMFTVSHELVHFMRDFAPEQFDKFAGFLFASYAKKGLSVRHAVHQEMMAHQSLKYDEAYEEVVARLSESFLRDAHLSEKSKALYNADKSLWQSIKDGLEKVINKIKESFADIAPESQLGKIGQKMVRENQDILDRFVAGIREAADNAAYIENTTDGSNENRSGNGASQLEQSRDSIDRIAYKYAVKNNDTERAQQIVDRAANQAFSESKVRGKDGKLRKVYHWTNSDFFTFETDRSGKNQGQTHGDGIYVSTSPDEFSYAGSKRMELYANITNPFEMQLTDEQAREVLERYGATKHNLDKYDGLYRNHAMAALTSPIKVFDYLKEYAADNNIKVSDILKQLGFDGVHDGSEWVAFDSDQLKSSDPITYDDDHNYIPLSERFNSEEKDIRYDEREGDLFEDDDLSFGEYDDISDVIKRQYTTHSEAIGEVLKNTADIDIAAGKVKNIVSRLMNARFSGIDQQTKRTLAIRLQAELENAKKAEPQDIVNNMIDAVRGVLDDAKETDDHAVELYDELKEAFSGRYYLTDEQLMDLQENGETLNSFKKAMMGKMTIINKDNAKHSIYGGVQGASELSLEGIFDLIDAEEIFGINRDQWDEYGYHTPVMLMDAFENLKENQEVPLSKLASSDDMDYIATQIAAEFTGAVVQEKYNSRKNPYVKDLVNKFEARKKEAVKKRNAYYAEKMKEIREQRDKKIAEQVKKTKEARKSATVQRKRSELKERIRKMHKSLRDMAMKPKVKKYIPSELLNQSIDVMAAVNLDSGLQGERADKFRQKLRDLSHTLLKLKSESGDAEIDAALSSMLDNLSDRVGNTPLGKMSLDQLKMVHDTLKAVQTNIRNRIEVIGAEKTRYIYDVAFKMIGEIDDAKVRKILGSKYVTTQLSSERFFNMICGGAKNNAGLEIYRMLDDGQLKQIELETRFARMFEDLVNDKRAKELSRYGKEHLVDIGLVDEQGNKVKITRGMMLSLYMHLMNDDNIRHVMGGGLSVPFLKSYYTGEMDKAFGSKLVRVRDSTSTARDIAKQIEEKRGEINDDTPYEQKQKIWDEIEALEQAYDAEVQRGIEEYINPMRTRIEKQLTDYDKEWIKTAKQFFDVESKNELNKVTYELYGFEKAVVKNYFPIHSDTAFTEQKFETIVRDMSLENIGMMKSRVGSANPIFLEDITDVINKQISNVAQYCGMVIPMANVKRILNVKGSNSSTSVMAALRKYDGKAKSYIEKLLGDLVGANKGESGIIDKARHGLAGAALTMNLKVAIKQAASYPTAAAELGYIPLAKALVKGGKNNWALSRADKELIYKYSPLLAYRSMGYSNQELGDLKDSKGLVDKVMNNPKLKWAFGWIQAMDTATVGRLWYASQYYVDKSSPDLKKGSDEYYREVARVFNNVVERTQPNYTVLQRPQLLRSTNAVTKMFTMFMTQRLQNFNIIYNAGITWKKMKSDFKNGKNGVTLQDKKQASAKLARAITSQLMAASTLVGMTLLADAFMRKMKPWRDDDEDLTAGSMIGRWFTYFGDSLVGSVAGGSELYNLIMATLGNGTWYGLSANGLDSIDDLFTNVSNAIKKKDGKYLAKAASSLAQITGIPLQNAKNILVGLKYFAEDFQDGKFFNQERSVKRTAKQNVHRSWSAYMLGNNADSKAIMSSLKESVVQEQREKGKDETQAKKDGYSSIRKAIQNLLRVEYLKAWQNYYHGSRNEDDYKKIASITNFMTAAEIYEKPDVKKTLKNWWDDATEAAEEKGLSMNDYLKEEQFNFLNFLGDTGKEFLGELIE